MRVRCCVGGAGTYAGVDPGAVLRGSAHGQQAPRHAGGQRWLWQDSSGWREAGRTVGELRRRQRAVQLLHDVG